MTGSVRIALLGVRHYHANFWAKAISQSENGTVAGVWDADAALAASFTDAHGVAAFVDRAALLAECDAVAIASATADHKPLIQVAAKAGKPILCEKPLAVSAEEGLAIRDILARTGVPFMQSFPKRLDPATRAVAEVVHGGDLGRLTLCRIRHGHSHGLRDDFHTAWFTDPAQSGGGTLLDEGIHAADMLGLLFGRASRAWATTSSAALALPVEDTALASFTYDGGMIAEVATGWCFAAADASVEIYGTAGTLLLSGVDLASRDTRAEGFLQVYRRNGESGRWQVSDLVPHFKTGVFHEHVAWAFIDALSKDTAMPTGVKEGLDAFAMVNAAYRAAATGQAQPIAYPEASR